MEYSPCRYKQGINLLFLLTSFHSAQLLKVRSVIRQPKPKVWSSFVGKMNIFDGDRTNRQEHAHNRVIFSCSLFENVQKLFAARFYRQDVKDDAPIRNFIPVKLFRLLFLSLLWYQFVTWDGTPTSEAASKTNSFAAEMKTNTISVHKELPQFTC